MDDDLPKKPTGIQLGEDLSTHSVAELTERMAHLKDEIVRVEEAITAKKGSQAAADAFFKK
ncbi:MAG: DUF1192 domain-containing protein [Hyphomicrobiales bacterium]|nr:DUF1192 domain-containing protein [Hyphomicrobiales bacterium]